MKIPFEVRHFEGQNVIFADNVLFDWQIDPNSLDQIKEINTGVELDNVHESIRSFFIESLSCFLQKKVTLGEVIEALKIGYIEI